MPPTALAYACVSTDAQDTALAYARVSTDAQDTARQQEHIARYCLQNQVELLATILEPPVSGRAAALKRSPAHALAYYEALARGDLSGLERPAYKDLLLQVAARRPTYVILYALDRLSRDATELLILQRYLAARGVTLLALNTGGPVDSSTAAGWLQFAMLAVFAELEVRQTQERTRATLRTKLAAGRLVGRPPVGWRQCEDGSFAHDPAVWPTVEAVVAARAAGKTYREIATTVANLIPANPRILRGCLAGRPANPERITRGMIRSYLRAAAWQPGAAVAPARGVHP